MEMSQEALELLVCANFAEVWLAKEGHNGLIGVNYLEKIQLGHLPSLYGAMLAGVAYILIGAGIPLRVPDVLDKLADHQPASYRVAVEGARAEDEHWVHFDPKSIIPNPTEPLVRPNFLPIVSSATLAEMLLSRSTATINGLVVEGYIAGGHNAPPRGKLKLSDTQEPVYGERDEIDIEKIRSLGAPFWLAGGYASPERIADAMAAGAAGVQVGSIFALAEESALLPDLRHEMIRRAFTGRLDIKTDAFASPSSFPFKVVSLPGTLAYAEVYRERARICDVNRLRRPYMRSDGSVGFRCPSEPIAQYMAKGGKEEDTDGKKCLCNALLADVGLAEHHANGYTEPPLVTLGQNLSFLPKIVQSADQTYTVADALAYQTGEGTTVPPAPTSHHALTETPS
jgi:NAD(P)H-dependent flavin oxidoreductase YrpB (nitropropane dioxygenase family)